MNPKGIKSFALKKNYETIEGLFGIVKNCAIFAVVLILNNLNLKTMKKMIMAIAVVLVSIACVAEDKPVTFEQLPTAAKEFINVNYPGEKMSYAFVDDDVIRPDYTVRLANGVEITFEHDGSLEKITDHAGVPAGVVPVQITDYVKSNYPDASIVEYEIGKREFEVKLTNRLELKFNSSFRLKGLDD